MDAKVAQRLAEVLTTQRDTILAEWISTVRDTLRGRLTDAELKRQIGEMYVALVAAFDGGATTIHAPAAAEITGLLSDLSRSRAQHGFSATETAVSVFAVKEAVRGVIGEDSGALADHAAFSSFIDQLGLFTFETYVAARDSLINEQAEQLLELSTPVVKLWDGIVAVPLVGTLDSARSQVVMERLLQALVDTGSPYAILDITGVPAIDTQVAQHIIKTIVAAQLMGADCIISGIRPQIAQTIVSLGIEFGEIVTKANLADALKYAMRQQDTEIGRRAGRSAV
jgi:rsbT co-antagonist protein RsbR